MTCEEALNTCKMALKAIAISHSPQNDYKSVAGVVKEMSKEHDIETLMMCAERQIPKKPLQKYEHIKEYMYCANCGEYVSNLYAEYKPPYCKQCGQAIDWSDSDDRITTPKV